MAAGYFQGGQQTGQSGFVHSGESDLTSPAVDIGQQSSDVARENTYGHFRSGIGIAREDLETIFDKFYEVGAVEEHSTDKVSFKGRGAGLGLTIAKGVISLHSGTVWVESPGYDPERFPGSTFYVLLPVVEEPLLEGPVP